MEPLDAIDAAILQVLATDGRIPNNALAARVGLAPSTCLVRVRALQQRGVIRGFAADVDPAALGFPIQAMVAITMQAHARGRLAEYMDEVLLMPGVLNAYLLAGGSDFLVHVAAASVEELRTLVIDRVSQDPDVASTETSLIFRYARATRVPVTTG
jgi:DNA-binding Lrp family transcriptional regulator